MKKWLIGAASSIILIPVLALCWQFLIAPWFLPPKVTQHTEEISKIEDLTREHEGRIQQTEQQQHEQAKINELQIQSVKEQIQIMKDWKK